MKLNAKQIISLFEIASDLGFVAPVSYEIVSKEETSGDILVEISNSVTDRVDRFRLWHRGGHVLVASR